MAVFCLRAALILAPHSWKLLTGECVLKKTCKMEMRRENSRFYVASSHELLSQNTFHLFLSLDRDTIYGLLKIITQNLKLHNYIVRKHCSCNLIAFYQTDLILFVLHKTTSNCLKLSIFDCFHQIYPTKFCNILL